jgi:hypothetical protein
MKTCPSRKSCGLKTGYLLGETDAGRPLFCVVIEFPGNKACPVTARDMTTKEKRRYAEWGK